MGWRSLPSPTVTTSASSATATPGGWLSEKLASDDSGVNRSGPIVTDDGEVLGTHEGSWRYTIGQRRGLRIGTPAADGQPRYVLDIEPTSGTVTVGPRAALAVDGLTAIRPRWCGAVPQVPVECTVQLRAHGDEHRAVVTVDGEWSTYTSSTRPPASHPARRSWSTTGLGWSARPRSTRPAGPASRRRR